MNHFRRKFALWVAALCLLLTVAISPAVTRAQTSSSSRPNAGTARKPKKKIKKGKTTAGEKASAPDTSTKPSQEGPGSSPTPSPSPGAVLAKGAPKAPRVPADNTAGSEIAAARASGKVWVNLDSGVYHRAGRWYGKTKNGKFMTEAEAKAAGYKASQRN
jgi:hypothetical protein